MYLFYFVKQEALEQYFDGNKSTYKSTNVSVLLCKTGGVGNIHLR